jgi:uncharacterized membrane protein
MTKTWKKLTILSLYLCLGVMFLTAPSSHAAEGAISLYTPYTEISVTPGESINYNVDVMNNTHSIQNVPLMVNVPSEEWDYELTSGGWQIGQISVKANESESVSLQIEVPLKINKGTYRVYLVAEGQTSLPLTIHVTEQGTYKTELITEQSNLEGYANSSYRFETTIRNRTAEVQHYALTANAPQGWDVTFEVDGKNVTSVDVEANSTKDITINVQPAEQVEAGSYTIPIKASTNSTSAETNLEVVIKGTFNVELSTPNGLLSTEVTAGDEKKVTLTVTNTGTSELKNIELSANTPVDWEVTFDPKTIETLAPGDSTEVTATIKANDEAIAGDYVVSMSARSPEAVSDAEFRVAVKTSLLWGWIGVLIILAVLGGVYYLFRKYGRR